MDVMYAYKEQPYCYIVRLCIYTYISTYIHTYIFKHDTNAHEHIDAISRIRYSPLISQYNIYIYIYIYICISCTCIRVYRSAMAHTNCSTHTNRRIHIHTYIHTYIHKCQWTHGPTFQYIHICINTHTYIHTYICTGQRTHASTSQR
jgi:hypothetical protein